MGRTSTLPKVISAAGGAEAIGSDLGREVGVTMTDDPLLVLTTSSRSSRPPTAELVRLTVTDGVISALEGAKGTEIGICSGPVVPAGVTVTAELGNERVA